MQSVLPQLPTTCRRLDLQGLKYQHADGDTERPVIAMPACWITKRGALASS